MAHPAPPVPPIPPRFTVPQYLRLVDDGILDEDDAVELLEGVVVAMAPQGLAHSTGVMLADHAIRAAVGDRAVVRCQLSLQLGDHSMPEPDVAVLPGRLHDYLHAHPTTALLVAEVADSSIKQDRITKGAIYAEHGIGEYWIVNLAAEHVEVHRDPRADERRYRVVSVHRRGELIEIVGLPGAMVDVGDLLPPPRA